MSEHQSRSELPLTFMLCVGWAQLCRRLDVQMLGRMQVSSLMSEQILQIDCSNLEASRLPPSRAFDRVKTHPHILHGYGLADSALWTSIAHASAQIRNLGMSADAWRLSSTWTELLTTDLAAHLAALTLQGLLCCCVYAAAGQAWWRGLFILLHAVPANNCSLPCKEQ